MTTWKTLYDKIIVKRHDADKVTLGVHGKGIAVAETHEKAKNTGIVVSIGAGRILPGNQGLQTLAVKVGQEVLFHEHSGVPLEPDDDSLIILREDEILAYRDLPSPLAAVV